MNNVSAGLNPANQLPVVGSTFGYNPVSETKLWTGIKARDPLALKVLLIALLSPSMMGQPMRALGQGSGFGAFEASGKEGYRYTFGRNMIASLANMFNYYQNMTAEKLPELQRMMNLANELNPLQKYHLPENLKFAEPGQMPAALFQGHRLDQLSMVATQALMRQAEPEKQHTAIAVSPMNGSVVNRLKEEDQAFLQALGMASMIVQDGTPMIVSTFTDVDRDGLHDERLVSLLNEALTSLIERAESMETEAKSMSLLATGLMMLGEYSVNYREVKRMNMFMLTSEHLRPLRFVQVSEKTPLSGHCVAEDGVLELAIALPMVYNHHEQSEEGAQPLAGAPLFIGSSQADEAGKTTDAARF